MPDRRPTLAQSLSRFANRLRARGPAEVGSLAVARATEAWGSNDSLIVFFKAAGGRVESPPGMTFRAATPADAVRYAREIGTDSATSFRIRLSASTRCFVVEADGLFVHSSWVTTAAAWTREIRGYMVPPRGDAYVYESYTRPEVRGRGVYPFALHSVCEWAGDNNVERVWVAVEADNPASIRAVEKAGFEEAFRFDYARSFGRLRVEKPTGRMAQIGSSFVRRSH